MLSRFERTRIISARALQLAYGAPPLIDVPKGIVDPYDVARMEFERGVIPFVVVREYPDGTIEIVEVS
ncbi:MAG: DNA-directed RNA polymerase subunit K [Candidatus Diapherotrites archaeon]|nr:DNA-directed RNA polymerase subunit K [Candidatus Diapherotrites archaeon]